MSFHSERRALTDAAFATFGLAATFNGAPVVVRLASADQDIKFQSVSVIASVTRLRVRSWEVAVVSKGDTFEITEGPAEGSWQLIDKPMRDRRGVWDAAAERVA